MPLDPLEVFGNPFHLEQYEMTYKLDNCPEGINTRCLTRVTNHSGFVACFTSYQDALDFVTFKEAQQKSRRAESLKTKAT